MSFHYFELRIELIQFNFDFSQDTSNSQVENIDGVLE